MQRAVWPILQAGWARGGNQPEGGITWNDWRDHQPIPLVSQIFGHTKGNEVRRKWHGLNVDMCIDTGLKHVVVLNTLVDHFSKPFIDEILVEEV